VVRFLLGLGDGGLHVGIQVGQPAFLLLALVPSPGKNGHI